MNSYTSIDLATWKRRGTFEYYRTFQNQLFNITLEFPAAELYRYAKRNRISFFLLTLHAILRAVNSVPQFRQRIVDGGQVIEFEHVAALTPIMTPEEEFVMALTEYAPSFAEFRGQAEAAVAAAKRGEFDPSVRQRNDFICASCVPWYGFRSLTQAALTLDQSIVILTWGKMDASDNIPLALQLNHALVDGLHIGRFHRALTGFLTAPASL